jgi:MSHA biogenesis protein MshI
MWNLRKTSPTLSSLTGVVPFGETLVLARINRTRGSRPRLEHYREIPADGAATRNFSHLIQAGIHARERLSLVTPWEAYKILLVDAPDVPPQELRSALRWKIKDLIDFHVDDALIDLFELPADSQAAGGRASLYCIAARAEAIRSLVDSVAETGAILTVIDIPEMCIRNLSALAPEDQQGLVTLHLETQRGLVVVTRQHTLYLARRLDFGVETLQLVPATAEQLALEIQRSMDYCDRHFHLALAQTVLILPTLAPPGNLSESLKEYTGLAVRHCDLNQYLDCARPLAIEEQARGLLAIGAALRLDPES